MKIKTSITLNECEWLALKRAAIEERRSVSSLVSWLIEQRLLKKNAGKSVKTKTGK